MPFQLHIRQNLDSARDHFGPGEVRAFAGGTVRIGSGPDCECRMDAAAFAPCQVVLEVGPRPAARVTASPCASPTATYLNQSPLAAPTVLRSGDELRVGHWTLRFLRVYDSAPRSRRFHVVSSLAKVAVAAILCAEVAMVAWLPQRMQRAAMWQAQIARHRVVDLLDRLRRSNQDSRSAGDFERSLRREVDRELQARLEYVATYGSQLSAERTRLLYEELLGFERVLNGLAQGVLPPPLPGVELDAGVKAVLNARRGR